MADAPPGANRLHRVRLWDPALRIFHWCLAICVVTSWVLGKFGPGIMTVHFYSGYAVIGLLVFRLIWGLFGAWPARFRDFLYGPRTLLAYVRHVTERTPSRWPGHNPIGSLSVFALLGVLGFQAYTGLYTDPEDFINQGPLVEGASGSMVGWSTGWHQTMAPVILVLVLLHLGAIAYYKFWKRENLIPSMIHGKKVVQGQVPESRILEEVSGKVD